jgi:hypothetical protein
LVTPLLLTHWVHGPSLSRTSEEGRTSGYHCSHGMAHVVSSCALYSGYAWWQGPPQNPRSAALVEAFVTVIGAGITVMAPSHRDCNDLDCHVGHIVLVVTVFVATRLVPVVWRMTLRVLRAIGFGRATPSQQERLTLDEFKQRGVIDTRRGLTELRSAGVRDDNTHAVLQDLARLDNPKPFIQFLLTGEHVPEEHKVCVCVCMCVRARASKQVRSKQPRAREWIRPTYRTMCSHHY